MKKILKYLLFVLTFCVVFFISFKINIHRLEFAPMKLMETEWDDSVGTVYVDLDYENPHWICTTNLRKSLNRIFPILRRSTEKSGQIWTKKKNSI